MHTSMLQQALRHFGVEVKSTKEIGEIEDKEMVEVMVDTFSAAN